MAKTKGPYCGVTLYKHFGLAVLIRPLILTGVFAVTQNIYLYCVMVKTVTRNSTSEANNNNSTIVAGIWRTINKTKKAFTTLLILSGTSVIFGILQPITASIVQSQVGYGLFSAIWFSLVVPFIYNMNILLHSVLYGFFCIPYESHWGLISAGVFSQSDPIHATLVHI